MEEVKSRLFSLLGRYRNDKKALTEMKRAIRPSYNNHWKYLAKVTDLKNVKICVICEIIMASFAYGISAKVRNNLGDVFKRFIEEHSTFEKRFKQIINCDTAEEVCERLKGLLRSIESKGFSINLENLFEDLWFWGDDIKKKWSNSLWR